MHKERGEYLDVSREVGGRDGGIAQGVQSHRHTVGKARKQVESKNVSGKREQQVESDDSDATIAVQLGNVRCR